MLVLILFLLIFAYIYAFAINIDLSIILFIVAGSPAITKCFMPTDFGQGPIPQWVEEIISKERVVKERQSATAPAAGAAPAAAKPAGAAAATLDQKCNALKAWIKKTLTETLKPRIGQFKGDVAASPRMAIILDICYGIKDFKTELDKLSSNLTFVATPPQSIPHGSSKLEILRAVTLAALSYIDSGFDTIIEKLPSFGADKIAFVTSIVQVVNKLKTEII